MKISVSGDGRTRSIRNDRNMGRCSEYIIVTVEVVFVGFIKYVEESK